MINQRYNYSVVKKNWKWKANLTQGHFNFIDIFSNFIFEGETPEEENSKDVENNPLLDYFQKLELFRLDEDSTPFEEEKENNEIEMQRKDQEDKQGIQKKTKTIWSFDEVININSLEKELSTRLSLIMMNCALPLGCLIVDNEWNIEIYDL